MKKLLDMKNITDDFENLKNKGKENQDNDLFKELDSLAKKSVGNDFFFDNSSFLKKNSESSLNN